jgi:WD40 repeat protein
MDFSEVQEQSFGHVAFSPSSSMVVGTVGSRLVLRDLPSLEVRHMYMCIDKIDRVEFSPDSKYILCGIFSRNAIQVFSVQDAEWKCRINEGVAGLLSARWAPDSRHVLVESDFGIQISVWSLSEVSCQVISYPKQGCSNGISFSEDGKFMAVAHRIDLHDHIGVYSTSPWSELSKFKCSKETGNDLSTLQWTPSGAYIVASDSHLQYNVAVYTPTGDVVTVYEAYTQALGLRQTVFHRPAAPMTEMCPLVALGSYDGNVRLVSSTHWKAAFVLPCAHPKDMEGGIDDGCVPTVELIGNNGEDDGLVSNMNPNKRTLGKSFVKKVLKTLPAVGASSAGGGGGRRTAARGHSDKLPKMGVSSVAFSHDGTLLAVRDESLPRCLWVWSSFSAKLQALVVQLDSITCARWRPSAQSGNAMLAYACASQRVYFWNALKGSYWVDLPGHIDLKVSTESLSLFLYAF